MYRLLLTSALALQIPAFLTAGEAAAPAETTPEARIKFSGFVEAGFTTSTGLADSRQIYGRTFDDRDREPLFHQLTLTLERALSSGKGKFDWGFKLQVTGGSDARLVNTLGTFDQLSKNTFTLALVEAYASIHLPVLTAGGVDLKFGQFVTLLGADVINPTANVFYSRNYLFNFGSPLQHLGALATWYVTPNLSLHGGVTRGVNTSLTDNNGAVSFTGGLGLTFLDGKVTGGYYVHIGPENVGDRRNLRQIHSLVLTVKPNDKVTLIGEGLFAHEAAGPGFSAGGVSGTVQYTFNKTFSLALRGEVFRDADGFFVGQFAKNDNFVDFLRGDFSAADPKTLFAGRATYYAVTLGATIKPQLGKWSDKLIFRPEIRYDRASRPAFRDLTKRDQVTFGVDAIFTF